MIEQYATDELNSYIMCIFSTFPSSSIQSDSYRLHIILGENGKQINTHLAHITECRQGRDPKSDERSIS
jgi:hypothetical protein